MKFLKPTFTFVKKGKNHTSPPSPRVQILNWNITCTIAGSNFHTKLNHIKLLCQYKELHNFYQTCLKFRPKKKFSKRLKRSKGKKRYKEKRRLADETYTLKNSNLLFKYWKYPKRDNKWDLIQWSQQNKMQISSMINGPDRLSAERSKASDSVHNSFWTLKKGFNRKLSFCFAFSLGCLQEVVLCFFPPCYAGHFLKPQKSNNFHILRDFF